MREFYGNLFETGLNPDAICITTNGFVKANGHAVCGRGCAKQACERWPEFPSRLGYMLRENGNIVQQVLPGNVKPFIVAFPVKAISELVVEHTYGRTNVVQHMRQQFRPGTIAPGWACQARTDIIAKSARELAILASEEDWQTIVLPRPGCGAGELSWSVVKPLLDELLDDRFYAVTYR